MTTDNVPTHLTKEDSPVDDIQVIKDEYMERTFTYHAPKHSQPERYTLMRENAKRLAYIIRHNCQPSREQSFALERLEEAVMWFNAAVARNE